MLKELEERTPSEVENIKRVIQDLFRSTCILQMKCDPETLVQRDNPRYKLCEEHRGFISDYLELLNCELVHDARERLFRVTGEGAMIEKMNLMTTRLVVLIKLIYHDKIMGDGLRATTTNLAEIRQYGVDTGLLSRKLTDQEWSEALTLMKTHQMIIFPGAIVNLEDDTPIYIYNTVNIYCNTASLGELVEYYNTGEMGMNESFDFTEDNIDEEETIEEGKDE